MYFLNFLGIYLYAWIKEKLIQYHKENNVTGPTVLCCFPLSIQSIAIDYETVQ